MSRTLFAAVTRAVCGMSNCYEESKRSLVVLLHDVGKCTHLQLSSAATGQNEDVTLQNTSDVFNQQQPVFNKDFLTDLNSRETTAFWSFNTVM